MGGVNIPAIIFTLFEGAFEFLFEYRNKFFFPVIVAISALQMFLGHITEFSQATLANDALTTWGGVVQIIVIVILIFILLMLVINIISPQPDSTIARSFKRNTPELIRDHHEQEESMADHARRARSSSGSKTNL